MRIYTKIAVWAGTTCTMMVAALPVLAQGQAGALLQKGLTNAGKGVYGATPPALEAVIGSVIASAFQILGALLLVMLLYGGFVWMTAMGEPDKTKKARQIITNAVIGLVIIASAYALSAFVIRELTKASNGGNAGVTDTTPAPKS